GFGLRGGRRCEGGVEPRRNGRMEQRRWNHRKSRTALCLECLQNMGQFRTESTLHRGAERASEYATSRSAVDLAHQEGRTRSRPVVTELRIRREIRRPIDFLRFIAEMRKDQSDRRP